MLCKIAKKLILSLFIVPPFSGEIHFHKYLKSDKSEVLPDLSKWEEFPDEFLLDIDDGPAPMLINLTRSKLDNNVPLLTLKDGQIRKYFLQQDEVCFTGVMHLFIFYLVLPQSQNT